MKTKANALLLCILMIASTLAGCAGDDVEVIKTLEQADCDAIGDGYTLDADHNVCVKEVTTTVTDIVGCMDAAADNYNSAANVAGECVVGGCDDSEATNFDAGATYNDGSCSYDQAYYLGKYASGDMSLAVTQEHLENLRMCKEDSLSGVSSACEIVAVTADIDPPMMDPADAYDTSSGAIIENVYDTLYRYEPSADGTPVLVPRLATGYSISEDGLTYTFTLREGVFFSNGEAFTAEDVNYSWCRVLEYDSPDSGVSWILHETLAADCSGLNVNPDGTFSATLKSAYSAFIPTIAFWIGAVIDKGTCEANRVITYNATTNAVETDDHCNAYMHNNPIGTNAYVLGSYVEEQEIVLEPNWLYWESGNFNLNKITRSEVAEESTRVASLKNGDVDFGSVSVA